MKADAPQLRKGGGSRSQRPSRKLNFPSRMRKSFRQATDRLLGADLVWSGALVVVLLLVLGGHRCGPGPFELGQAAPHDIRAREDRFIEDLEATEERRQARRGAVPDVYLQRTEFGDVQAARLAKLFAECRGLLELGPAGTAEIRRKLADELGTGPSAESVDALIELEFAPSVEAEIAGALKDLYSGVVVASRSSIERRPRITLQRLPGGDSDDVDDYGEFVDLEEARVRIKVMLAARLDLPESLERRLGSLAAELVEVNTDFNPLLTEQRRLDAERAVRAVGEYIRKGEVVVEKGEPLTRERLDTIQMIRPAEKVDYKEVLAVLFGACLFAFFLYRYTRYHQRAFRKLEHLHALIVLMLVAMLLMSRAVQWLARIIVDDLVSPFNKLESYTYLIPLGAGAILVALLANGRIATVYAGFASLLFGAAVGWEAHMMVWGMIVQCAGVYAISTYRERAALLRAGLVVGGVGAVAVFAFETIKGTLQPVSETVYGAGLAFVGGAVGVGLLISFTLPMLERLFNVLTDIRLLELSDVNNPLLQELAVKAPGSYNHSLVVGTLAEEGARAIGANALFCRVAAQYHDIGKMNKPEYYVENQRGGNPHDRLSPSMSALVIASHVKDGIKMAREAGLPEQIVDIIPQHHGTKLIKYFYEKAKANADPSLGPVKEEDFRYPGPKPQTREAAIFMLADGVEAAARTVEEPTPNRLKEMIRKVTSNIVLDRELDSCDLTFSDLEKIQKALLRCLVSMYHHRVDYPGFDFGKPKGESKGERRNGSKREEKSGGPGRERDVVRSG